MATLSEEISKLIAHRLLSGEGVTFPEIGALQVRRIPARRIGKGIMAPPSRRIEFTPSPVGISLVEDILRAAACSKEQAEDAYHRWLSHASTDGTLHIEGIGTLCEGRFTLDPSFGQRLNPRGDQPIRVKQPLPWWAWSLITIGVIFALFGGLACVVDPLELWNRWSQQTKEQRANTISEVIEESEEIPPMESIKIEQTMSDSVVTPPPAPQPNPAPQEEEIIRTRSGMSYVVLGIYSTEQNARRAIEQATSQYQIPNTACRIFLYADKYLVSLGETEKRAEAQTIASRYRSEQGVKDVWVYSKK